MNIRNHNRYRRRSRGPFLAGLMLACTGLGSGAVGPAFAQTNAGDAESTTQDSSAPASSTIVYDRTFFASYPNAVSVLDIIRRIPSGQSIIEPPRRQSRGFSANEDRVLINGKRVSGKQNDSQSALRRITMDQVERIEIIRGSSPDIKIASGKPVINIILKSGAKTGSGSWRGGARMTEDGDIGFGAALSYGNSIGALDYFLSAQTRPERQSIDQTDDSFDAGGLFTGRLNEAIGVSGRRTTLTANLAYTFGGGSALRINGLYAKASEDQLTAGSLSGADGLPTGESWRLDAAEAPSWEIGGDYETRIGDNLTLKLLALHAEEDKSDVTREDFLIEGGDIADDVFSTNLDYSVETIGRGSLTWKARPGHEIEFGTEFAFNKLDSDLEYFERIAGVLVEVDLPGDSVLVEETRNETFVSHTWTISEKATIETGLTTEYSKISQSGVDLNRSRSFFYLKPRLDFRYNLTPLEQVQFTARHNVQQLDFEDFAASTNDDNKTFGGNTELEPQRSFEFDLSYEKRFADDAGRIKVTAEYTRFIGRIELVPLPSEDGALISGKGNAGNGNFFQLDLQGSFRMIALGLPDLVIEPGIKLRRHRIRDPFTGEKRAFARWNSSHLVLNIRHDITDWGLSYGGKIERWAKRRFFDIDETSIRRADIITEIFVEKSILGGITARFMVRNITDPDRGRDRFFYADGYAAGVITSSEIRERREGRVYSFSLRGTF